MSNKEKEKEELARLRVDEAIRALGIKVISDEQMEKELDQMLLEETALGNIPENTSFSKFMGEARRRFIHRADLEKVSKRLKEKLEKK